MSEAVRRLLFLVEDAASHCEANFMKFRAMDLREAIAAVEAELNQPQTDTKSKDYPDYVENYR